MPHDFALLFTLIFGLVDPAIGAPLDDTLTEGIALAQLDEVRLGFDCDAMHKSRDEAAWSRWNLSPADALTTCLMATAGSRRPPAICANEDPRMKFSAGDCVERAAALAAEVEDRRASLEIERAVRKDPVVLASVDAALAVLDADDKLRVRVRLGKVRPQAVTVAFDGRANPAQIMWVAAVAQSLRHGTARHQRAAALVQPPPPVTLTLEYAESPGCLPVGARIIASPAAELPGLDKLSERVEGLCPEGPVTIVLPSTQLAPGVVLSLPGNGILEVL